MEKKIVLITGATSGIGQATAIKFARNGYDLIITGRRGDRLHELAVELEKSYSINVLPLEFDITDPIAVEKAFELINKKLNRIDILVNNAGLAAGLDTVQDALLEDWEQMIDTNIKGLLYVTKKVLPLMIQARSGHIINIGSTAGKEVYPKGNVYCATKHAVDALTKGMRVDLLEYGIKVTQVAPGAVETEFSMVRFKGDHEKAKKVYQGYKPLVPENIADIIYFVATLPNNVNINDIVVTSLAQANSFFIQRNNS